jgi:hypothetical protein
LEIAERIAKLELIPSLNPARYIKFYKEHSEYYIEGNPARVLGIVAMWIVTSLSFLTGLFTKLSITAAKKAANAAQVAFHAKWDLPVIGNMKVGVIHISSDKTLPESSELVVQKGCKDAADAVEFIKQTHGTDNLSGSGREQFDLCIVVDHTNNVKKTKRKLSDSGINKAAVISADEFKNVNASNQNAVLQKIISRNHGVYNIFGQIIGLKIDDDFIESLEVHNLSVNGDMYIEMNKLKPQMRVKIREMAKELKRCGVLVHFIEEEGLSGKITEFNLKTDKQTDSKFTGKILEIVIPEDMTEKEIKDAFEKLNLSQKMMFRSSEVRSNINKLQDITDKNSFAAFFNIIINLGQKEITSENVFEYGKNWKLPLAKDAAGQIRMLHRGNLEGLKSIINPDSVQALIDEKNELEKNKLGEKFMEGVLARTMITAKLMEKDEQCALEYMSDKYKINKVDETKFAKELLEKIGQTGSIAGDFDILNLIITDWRLSKPIRQDGLGKINTNNFKLVLGAA